MYTQFQESVLEYLGTADNIISGMDRFQCSVCTVGEVTATAYAHSHVAAIYLQGGASFAQIQGQHIFFRKSDGFRGTAVQVNRLLNGEHLCLPSANPSGRVV
jgi:hypothetical protein